MSAGINDVSQWKDERKKEIDEESKEGWKGRQINRIKEGNMK